MTQFCYLNGKYIEQNRATVSINDRGFQLSDGIYDVILIKNGHLIDLENHVKRIHNSLSGLYINYAPDQATITDIAKQLIRLDDIVEGSLYIQITRGVAKREHKIPNSELQPTVLCYINKPMDWPTKYFSQGIQVFSQPDIRWQNRDLKTISLLANVLIMQKAYEKGCIEAILYEQHTKVITECGSSNFFIVDANNVIKTHPANSRILNGVTRQRVIKLAKQHGLQAKEEEFTLDDAINAKEVFLTSTNKHVLPITNIDGRKVSTGSVGPITKTLIKIYFSYLEEASSANGASHKHANNAFHTAANEL